MQRQSELTELIGKQLGTVLQPMNYMVCDWCTGVLANTNIFGSISSVSQHWYRYRNNSKFNYKTINVTNQLQLLRKNV